MALPVGLLLPLIRFGRAGLVFVAAMRLTTDGRQELRRPTNLLFGGAAWRQARDNPTQARISASATAGSDKLTGKFSASCGQFFVVVRS